jgi:hypothetical protein
MAATATYRQERRQELACTLPSPSLSLHYTDHISHMADQPQTADGTPSRPHRLAPYHNNQASARSVSQRQPDLERGNTTSPAALDIHFLCLAHFSFRPLFSHLIKRLATSRGMAWHGIVPPPPPSVTPSQEKCYLFVCLVSSVLTCTPIFSGFRAPAMGKTRRQHQHRHQHRDLMDG